MRSIGYQTDRFARIGFGINTASNFVGVAPTGCAPACEREFALAEPMFDCRIYQRGAKWHWQIVNDFEHVLASGVAESNLEARKQSSCNASNSWASTPTQLNDLMCFVAGSPLWVKSGHMRCKNVMSAYP